MEKCLYYTLLLFLLCLSFLSSNGAQIQFDASVITNCSQQACTYSWNNNSIWIGGQAPSPNDDVIINISKNVVTLTCDNNCAANSVTTSGKLLTFQLPGATTATFERFIGLFGALEFRGGSFNIKNFTNVNDSLVFCQCSNIDMTVDYIQLTSLQLIDSTAKIGSISIQSSLMLFYAQATIQNYADIFDILSLEGSILTFQSGCYVPDVTPSAIINSTINMTPDCQFILGSPTKFYGSQWNIVSTTKTSYTLSAPLLLVNSTVNMTGVTLSVKSDINMRNNSVIQSDTPIQVLYGGTIGGEGSIIGDLTVKNFGKIQSRYKYAEVNLLHLKLTVLGTLSFDQSTSINLQHYESIQANSILLGDSTLLLILPYLDWTINELNYTAITATQGDISGEFGFMNVTVSTGFFQFKQTKSDLTMFWQRNEPPMIPYSVNQPIMSPVANPIHVTPHSVNQPTAVPTSHPEVISPQQTEEPTDSKTIIIVVESVMLGLGLILGGFLIYRRFIKRRGYNQVPNFDQL